MRIWKAVFAVLTMVFAAAGLMQWLPYDISLPVMFVFLGLVMLVNAKECYDKGAKWDAAGFCGAAVFVYGVTVYNLISRIL